MVSLDASSMVGACHLVISKRKQYSPTTELPDPKAQMQGRSAGTVKLAKPH